ncbi:choline/ethanolamine kinase [Anabrus simplex]|uniref:choline/ethanolamine kinase n=1 Tax=Anabrus simplex TaxID=316456 RepID=UPI0035A33F4D
MSSCDSEEVAVKATGEEGTAECYAMVQTDSEDKAGQCPGTADKDSTTPEAAETMTEQEDIREKAHRLCREYLHGAWRTVTAQELIIKKVSGGLSNLLFYCALPSTHPALHGEPVRVLLRLYGQIHGERALEGLITESVIFTLLSESQRGPRLFGVFPGGRIEEYIPARPLLTDELSDPELSVLIAEKTAQIHMMNVPISKEPRWLWETMERWLETIEVFMNQKIIPDQFQAMVNKVQVYNLRTEVQWLKNFLIAVKSPVVFCHNDLQEGNILLRNDIGIFNEEHEQLVNIASSNGNPKPGKKELVVIDFEYCSYNYRGFDFANHMCEWEYDYTNEEPPYFWAKSHNRATQEQQERFIISYLQTIKGESLDQESNDSTSSPTRKEIEQLFKEIKAFTLASHFFWGLWSVVNTTVSKITFDYWGYGEARFEAYFKCKSELPSEMESTEHADNGQC